MIFLARFRHKIHAHMKRALACNANIKRRTAAPITVCNSPK